MVNPEWFKDVLMITKMITKDDDKKLKGQSKNEFKIESRILQDSRGKLNSRIKNQESRIKIQDSRDQDSRLKIQESRKGYSRIKKKLNQDKYENVFFKNWVAHGFFSKHVYQRGFTLW